MNQPGQIRVGNFAVLRMLTASDVDYPDSEEHLAEIIRSFNLRDIVITLARINLLLQRSENPFECERILRDNFCSRFLRSEIERRGLSENIIFNRAATLLLLEKSISIAGLSSMRTPDSTVDTRNELGQCYLIANGFFDSEDTEIETVLTEDQRKESLSELIRSWEYSINPSPWHHIRKSLVRSEEFLAGVQHKSSSTAESFSQATGLNLKDYQYLIFSILNINSNFTPEEILDGSALFVGMNQYPDLTPLYDKLLQHTCICIDELPLRARTASSLSNEFRLWRQYPLVKLSQDEIFCIDISFLKDKLETGVFWIIRDQLEMQRKNQGRKIFELRGEIFEDYVASIIKRVLPSIETKMEDDSEGFFIRPKYDRQKGKECTDIAVCGRESLVLLESKAPLLAAKTKFGHDFCDFHHGIKDNAIKGIRQLSNAILNLGHSNKKRRFTVKDIDVSRIKKIYPVLVLSDRIFSLLFMNSLLNSEFQRLVTMSNLQKHLEIMPLTVWTIDDLENLEPHLYDTPLHEHLDSWITQVFCRNEFLPFSEYLRSLSAKKTRRNAFINQEIDRIHSDMLEYFTSRGVE